jgi:hypothetical protein
VVLAVVVPAEHVGVLVVVVVVMEEVVEAMVEDMVEVVVALEPMWLLQKKHHLSL